MENGNTPATKQDIAALKQEVTQEFAMVRSEAQHMYDDLKETMRDIQTEMLKAFSNFAQANNRSVA